MSILAINSGTDAAEILHGPICNHVENRLWQVRKYWPSKSMVTLVTLCNREDVVVRACNKTFGMRGYYVNWMVSSFIRSCQFRYLTFKCLFSCPNFNYIPILFVQGKYLSLIIAIECICEFVDIIGCQLSCSQVVRRMEHEITLNWLSTLGGAFSALGDISEDWAVQAGSISLKQLKIAIKMEDPIIVSRCRLYSALSFMQRGYFKLAGRIVRKEYRLACTKYKIQDPRLKKMCLGIWTKLQYLRRISRRTSPAS